MGDGREEEVIGDEFRDAFELSRDGPLILLAAFFLRTLKCDVKMDDGHQHPTALRSAQRPEKVVGR